MALRSALFSALLATVLAAPAGGPARALGDCAADAMLVFDGSASMGELGFDSTAPTRIGDARIAMRRVMPRIAALRRIGLVIYGPGGRSSCSGIDLRFAPRADAAAAILAEIEALRPAGLTPIAASVRLAAEALGRQGIVVLVTDGNETCGGRPCTLGHELAARAPGLTVHVIGFRVDHDPFAWDSPEAGVFSGAASVAKCLSDATGGVYVTTETVDELAAALDATLGCPLIGLKGAPRGAATWQGPQPSPTGALRMAIGNL